MYKIVLAFIILISATQLQAQDNITPERKQAIDSLALEKVRDLSKYISIIGNKNTPFSEANRVIERTLELFAEGSQMGVSSLVRDEVRYYDIRTYLERLMALNYDRVTIRWYDIQYISDLERQPDGRYVGVRSHWLVNVELEQLITGRWTAVLFSDTLGTAADMDDWPGTEVLTTLGLGLRYQSPIGPLRLEYGRNLNPRDGDPPGTLHFSIGFPF